MKKVPINKDEYSESSKQSVGHEFLGRYYEDIQYNCSKCKKPAVFEAIEQKKAYEDRKEYMWARRFLCTPCWKEMRTIKNNIKQMDEEYQNEKLSKSKDVEFLREWLEELEEYKKYGKKGDEAKIKSIHKLLGST